MAKNDATKLNQTILSIQNQEILNNLLIFSYLKSMNLNLNILLLLNT